MAEKKKCPYCDKMIGRAGWKMHYAHAHVERKYVPFDKVGASEDSGGGEEQSFRQESPREPSRKSKPIGERRERKREEPEEEDDSGGLESLFDGEDEHDGFYI